MLVKVGETEIEAFQWDGEPGNDDFNTWLAESGALSAYVPDGQILSTKLEGPALAIYWRPACVLCVQRADWVVRFGSAYTRFSSEEFRSTFRR